MEGREFVEGKDFEIEDQFWNETSWWPTKHLVDGKVKPGTKTRTIAISIDKPQAQGRWNV